MKKFSILLIVIAVAAIVAVGAGWFSSDSTPVAVDCSELSYDDYPASSVYTGEPAEPDFSTNEAAQTFRTRITEGAAAGPNFAGSYTVVTWGCGTSCQGGAIVDARDGDIPVHNLVSSFGFGYELGSRLLVTNPPENLPTQPELVFQGLTTDYYLFEGGTLTLLCSDPVGERVERDAGLIRVAVPEENAAVSSPLTIRGEARGSWFFEATFPVELRSSGAVIARGYVEATDNWMTEDFVPFTGTLEFSMPDADTGVLVLEKANPSGLPEHAAEVSIPVRFR